uniref:Uncharacterized protein n=1 Tax=Lepeophtheirus salmonis TaxID=72036 RepID=A0A0K2UMS1_LEPSM
MRGVDSLIDRANIISEVLDGNLLTGPPDSLPVFRMGKQVSLGSLRVRPSGPSSYFIRQPALLLGNLR